MANIVWFQLLNVRISLSFLTVNEKIWGFGLLAGPKKLLQAVTLGSGGMMSIYSTFSDIDGQTINLENNCQIKE